MLFRSHGHEQEVLRQVLRAGSVLGQFAVTGQGGGEEGKDVEKHDGPELFRIGVLTKDRLAADHQAFGTSDQAGTTLLAAERTGRRLRGVDIDPAYVDVAIERWSARTGREPHLEVPAS